MYKTIVLPVSEASSLALAEHRLRVFQNSVLRKIFRVTREEEVMGR
jgi:hypothetical protein